MRFPDVPPRDFELTILKWVGWPILALLVVAVLTWAWSVRSARAACERQCVSAGRSGFIYIPKDIRYGRDEECVCTDRAR